MNNSVKIKGILKSKYWISIITMAIAAVVLNLLALSREFCDWYANNVFWLWSETVSRVNGIFPFSVGEVLIILLIVFVLVFLVSAVVRIFVRKKQGYKKYFRIVAKTALVLLMLIIILMTLNCSILYNCSRLKTGSKAANEYTVLEIEKMRNHIVEKCNELSLKMDRDEDSNVIFYGDYDEEIIKAMHKIANEYPRMSGYYPGLKPLWGSYFMYQSGTIGVYFPFSMESNYCKYLSSLYRASVGCHEYSHLKGYIYEDEANYIAFLACINSDSEFMQYAGYISVLYYVDNDYYDLVGEERYNRQVPISDAVYYDDDCYTPETREELKGMDSIIDTEVMREIDDTFTKGYLDYYGATANYNEVTLLMLGYYEGKLY